MLTKESVPPRPPLPKTYYPLEPSSTIPPSIPSLPFDSAAWLCSLNIDDGYLGGRDSPIRKVYWCFHPYPALTPPCISYCPVSSFKNRILNFVSHLQILYSSCFQTSIFHCSTHCLEFFLCFCISLTKMLLCPFSFKCLSH